MSDDLLIVVPSDPFVLQEPSRVSAAAEIAGVAFPRHQGLEISTSEKPQFLDAMQNFESVSCPSCGGGIDTEWWSDQMDIDFDGEGFRLLPIKTPCCGASLRLNELAYCFHCAFSRLVIELLNPDASTVPLDVVEALEDALETKVAFVHAHL